MKYNVKLADLLMYSDGAKSKVMEALHGNQATFLFHPWVRGLTLTVVTEASRNYLPIPLCY